MQQIIVDFGVWRVLNSSFSLRIHGYGLMLVLGFICGIWLAQRLARRAGADPNAITHCGLLALVGGILGARLAFVIERWNESFAGPNHSLIDIFDVTSGGLIYYGGVVLAMAAVLAYLRLKHLPIRRYMDILGVSLLVGLAFGRAGCLLNGCCYGGRCDAHWPLAMQFPMYSEPLVKLDGRANPFSQSTASPSPPYAKQLELGLLVPDERLMTPGMVNQPLPPAELHGRLDADQLAVMFGSRERAKELYDVAAGADGRLSRTEWDKDLAEPGGLLAGGELWQGVTPFGAGLDGQVDFRQVWSYLQRHRQEMLVRFDRDGDGALTGPQRDEANAYLQADQIALARATKSLPLKPAQALGIVNALLLAGILLAFYRLRRREGQVFALLLILYPITRFVLESIRADNPHDLALGILTHNQYTSLATIVVGAVLMLALAKMRPHAAIVAAGSGGSSSRPVRGRSAGHVKSRNRISQRPERAKEQK